MVCAIQNEHRIPRPCCGACDVQLGVTLQPGGSEGRGGGTLAEISPRFYWHPSSRTTYFREQRTHPKAQRKHDQQSARPRASCAAMSLRASSRCSDTSRISRTLSRCHNRFAFGRLACRLARPGIRHRQSHRIPAGLFVDWADLGARMALPRGGPKISRKVRPSDISASALGAPVHRLHLRPRRDMALHGRRRRRGCGASGQPLLALLTDFFHHKLSSRRLSR